MVRVTGTVTGIGETKRALEQTVTVLMRELEAAMRASLLYTVRISQKDYLSGPRPERLGVITNRLRSSLTPGNAGFLMDVTRTGFQLEGSIGTNVEYAAIHEYGGTIRPKHGTYLAIPSSFVKTPTGAFKSAYNMPLRQVPNTFVRSIHAPKAEAAVFQRIGKRIIPLAWLVRQVTIPKRPFLSTALKDAEPWIQTRVQQAIAAVETWLKKQMDGR